MRQALHILKKDIRYLRFEIAVMLVVTAAFAFIGARRAFWMDDPHANRSIAWTLVQLQLPFIWWLLIARVLHAETLLGDRQFWITRPYIRGQLLLAKLLFFALCVSLPMLVADAIILGAFGLSPVEQIAGLLWTQVLLWAVVLLPVAALCSVTRGVVESFVATFVLLLILLAWNVALPGMTLGVMWGALDWVTVYYAIGVTAVAAVAILAWQYARRRAWTSRAMAAATVVLVMGGGAAIPWTTAFAVQSHFGKKVGSPSSLHIGFDFERKWLARALVEGDRNVELEIPLHATGLPADTELKGDGLVATMQAPDGTVWRAAKEPWTKIDAERGILSLHAQMNEDFYRKIRDRATTLRGTLYFTLYGDGRSSSLPFDGKQVPVPGLGVCSAHNNGRQELYFLLCSFAFRPEPNQVSIRFAEGDNRGYREIEPGGPVARISYSPFPADPEISPVSQYFQYFNMQPFRGTLSRAVIRTLEPLGHFSREFQIDDLRLGDFEVRRTRLPE